MNHIPNSLWNSYPQHLMRYRHMGNIVPFLSEQFIDAWLGCLRETIGSWGEEDNFFWAYIAGGREQI